MQNSTGLSVVIITRHAAKTLGRVLESVAWANEKIVVDSGSQDNTLEIARAHGAKIYEQTWLGFGPQKQFALLQATQDWVLSLDADEILDRSLQASIQKVLAQPEQGMDAPVGYQLRFQSYFCGQAMHHGDWRNEQHLRLFRRELGKFSEDLVHETLQVSGNIGVLEGLVEHHSYPDWETVLDKMQRYSSLGAKKKWAAGKSAGFWTALGHSVWAFVRGYVLRAGFLDGRMGLLLALARAEETRYRYLKLAEMSRASS